MSSNPNPESRARLQELLAIPERDRTDAQWDEIHELEVQNIQLGNKPVHQKTQAQVRHGDAPPRSGGGPRPPGAGPGGPGGPNRGRRDFQKKHRRRPKG
jgi:hypothetical protein